MRRRSRQYGLLVKARSAARRQFEEGEPVVEAAVPELVAAAAIEADPEIDLRLEAALEAVRHATIGTPYQGEIWIVGGYVRDKALGRRHETDDVDLVMQASAVELANLLRERGVAEISPVVYPRFGTAMVRIGGCDVELVTARKESYAHHSRKPAEVEAATLEEDAERRDFTINTLLENLHTGETRDPLGRGLADIRAGILRTPLAPETTFADDPLRMLRAVRFAARLDFTIAPQTWDALCANAARLTPPKVSYERIRDEFSKMLMAAAPSVGLEMLRRSDLLRQFAPEICEMVGVTQNEFHSLPVWDHTLLALDNLIAGNPGAPLLLRLGTLLHDIGKPQTRSVGDDGRIHFYRHEDVGAEIARKVMARLKFSSSDIATVQQLVAQHMRIGEYKPERWSDSAVRRLIRETGDNLDGLFALHRADVSALSEEHTDASRAEALRRRIDDLETAQPSHAIESPLTGDEIMEVLGIEPGREVRRLKDWLLSEVLEGRIAAGDKEASRNALLSSRPPL